MRTVLLKLQMMHTVSLKVQVMRTVLVMWQMFLLHVLKDVVLGYSNILYYDTKSSYGWARVSVNLGA